MNYQQMTSRTTNWLYIQPKKLCSLEDHRRNKENKKKSVFQFAYYTCTIHKYDTLFVSWRYCITITAQLTYLPHNRIAPIHLSTKSVAYLIFAPSSINHLVFDLNVMVRVSFSPELQQLLWLDYSIDNEPSQTKKPATLSSSMPLLPVRQIHWFYVTSILYFFAILLNANVSYRLVIRFFDSFCNCT